MSTGTRYASAISEHPVAAQAVGEIAGQVLEQLDGRRIDVLLTFVSPHFAGATEDVAGVLRAILHPRVLVGATHAGIVGTGREVEDTAAISVWAASLAGTTAHSVQLDVVSGEHGHDLVGWPGDADTAHTLLVLGDPYTFPADGVLAVLARAHPGLQVIGGMASAASGPGGNHLIGGERVLTRGAVGVLLGGDAIVTPVVSQGCRPVGRPYVVTAADGHHLTGLGGRPALERIQELAADLDEGERAQLQQGLHLGVVVDEHKVEFGRGDFLVRNIVGARADDGALAVGASLDVGQTVQFQLRDAASADVDLHSMLAGHSAAGALLFTCTGRGERLFGVPDHDARVVRDVLGAVPLAGGFCAGELGPVGGRNHLHGFTASLALFA